MGIDSERYPHDTHICKDTPVTVVVVPSTHKRSKRIYNQSGEITSRIQVVHRNTNRFVCIIRSPVGALVSRTQKLLLNWLSSSTESNHLPLWVEHIVHVSWSNNKWKSKYTVRAQVRKFLHAIALTYIRCVCVCGAAANVVRHNAEPSVK